jgi:uncharacterized membrane protein YcaP (DUF421 family)
VEIIDRATVVFVFLFALTRGLKRRTLADMAPFELILLVVVGDVVQQGVTQEDFSLTGAVLAASTVAFWATLLSYVSWRWRPLGRVIDGVPIVIVRDGMPVLEALRVERMPLDEVFEAARQQGIESLEQVRLGVLEPGGRVSFIQR